MGESVPGCWWTLWVTVRQAVGDQARTKKAEVYGARGVGVLQAVRDGFGQDDGSRSQEYCARCFKKMAVSKLPRRVLRVSGGDDLEGEARDRAIGPLPCKSRC